MELQDRLIAMNEYRPFKSVFMNKITGNISRLTVKRLASGLLPRYFKKHPGTELYRKAKQEGRVSNAIVSMTSFPQRIGVVWLVIECLLRQTRVPKKIIVWLSRNQFQTEFAIPESLKTYPEEIVEVRMVDGDIRSHKKYWYAVREFKDQPLLLVDDDIIYDSRLVEDLEKFASSENKVISCCWGAKIAWNNDGTPKPYSQWGGTKPAIGEIADDFFYGSGGGTYFPIGSLDGAQQPVEDIVKVCPMADDIWLNAITRKNGFKTCLVRHQISVPEWVIKNNQKLNVVNNGEFKNDEQLGNVRMYMLHTFGVDPFIKQ